MKTLISVLLLLITSTVYSQSENQDSELPYREIQTAPEDYSVGNVISRMIDGLGFRYYWASEGLTQKDLDFVPSEGARSTFETLQHLYGLSDMIFNSPAHKPNIRPQDWSSMSYEDLRKATLTNIQQASNLVKGKTAEEIAEMKITFQRGDKTFDSPYWNMFNGPLADAIYHTGQVVSFRRISGNPINPKISVFSGTVKD